MKTQPTTQFGHRYIVHDTIGRGGMGVVYAATDRLSGKDIALKGVRLAPGKSLDVDNARAIAREFQVLFTLRHPNIISVNDFGFDRDGAPFYTMDLLKGATDIVTGTSGADIDQRLYYLGQIAEALEYIHSRGIVHRDLKPANVLLDDDRVRVLDFGLAFSRTLQSDASERLIGTPAYLAPELAQRSNQPTVRTELFALGVLASEVLCGTSLDRASTDHIDSAAWEFDIAPLRELDIDSRYIEVLEPLIRSLTARDPADRPNSARVVSDAVDELLAPKGLSVRFAAWESHIEASKFIGREDELEKLSGYLERSREGEGAVVMVRGESGIGKSRFVGELVSLAIAERTGVFRGHANPVRQNAYETWRNALIALAVDGAPSPEDAALLQVLAPDLADVLGPDVPAPPSMAPAALQQACFKAVTRLFEALDRPALILLEDLHWADSGSLALLAHVAAECSHLPVLIVGTARSEERADLMSELPGVEDLPLTRLAQDEIEELLGSMLGNANVSDELISLVNAESEGNAFFLVECLHALVDEAGRLDKVGKTLPRGGIVSQKIADLVATRLGRLAPDAHPLIDQAALMGRYLDLATLRKLSDQEDLDQWLMSCAASGVIEADGSEWRFSHDKFREGLRTRLPQLDRTAFHRQIAEAIEAVSDAPGRRADELMTHWGGAGDLHKELEYAKLATSAAIENHSTREAIRYLDRAIEIVRTLFDGPARNGQELELQLMRGGLLVASKGFAAPDVLDAFNRSLEICQELGDVATLAPVNRGLWSFFLVAAEIDKAMGLAGEVRRLGDVLGEPDVERYGRFLVAATRFWQGDLHGLDTEMSAFIDNVDRTSGLIFFESTLEDPEVQALSHFAWCNYLIGKPEEAERASQRAIEVGRATGRPESLAFALGFAGWYSHYSGQFDRAAELARESIALSTEHDLPYWMGAAYILQGGDMVRHGHADNGMRDIELGLSIWRATGSRLFSSTFLSVQAEAYHKLGDFERAEEVLREAHTEMKSTGERHNEAEVLCSMGAVAESRGDLEAARAKYTEAIEIARKQGAKEFERRATDALRSIAQRD